MLDLLFQGGPLIMGILSILLLCAIVLSIKQGIVLFSDQSERKNEQISNVKMIGTIAIVIGILGQLLGLYNAFEMIEVSENGISQQMLMGGLRVSMITSMYGLIIFLITRIIILVFNFRLQA